VIGGGSFGLAMASVVGKKGHPTCILVRKDDVSNSMPPKKVSGEEGRKGPCCGKLGGMVHGDGIPKHMLPCCGKLGGMVHGDGIPKHMLSVQRYHYRHTMLEWIVGRCIRFVFFIQVATETFWLTQDIRRIHWHHARLI